MRCARRHPNNYNNEGNSIHSVAMETQVCNFYDKTVGVCGQVQSRLAAVGATHEASLAPVAEN